MKVQEINDLMYEYALFEAKMYGKIGLGGAGGGERLT